MPKNVVAKAEVIGATEGIELSKTFTWRVLLNWDFKPYPTQHSINDRTFENSSPFSIDLSEQIRGGKLKVYAKANIGGQEVTGFAIAEVRAKNPPKSVILARFPSTRFGLIMSKVAMQESSLLHFTRAKGNDPGGLPELSYTNDVGLMQLNAPTGAVNSPEQVWDWRENLKRGFEMMFEKRRITHLASRAVSSEQPQTVNGYHEAACLSFLREHLGLALKPIPLPTLSDKPGSGILPGEADPDNLALSQLERDAIRRYNGGREYSLYLVSEFESLKHPFVEWRVDPTRGGIRAGSGDPEYVVHVLNVKSGFTFPPPKPSAPKTRTTKRRTRR